MARTPNQNKPPISNAVRVRMHRERKKMKKNRQQLIDNTDIHNGMDTNNLISESSTSSSPSLSTELRDWANSHRISKRALDDLLGILNSNGINSVPKNHRTLLKTPVDLEIVDIAGGSLWYNGLEKSIREIFSTIDCDMTISLNVNVDGLPLYNSSKISFWPILASIYGMCNVYVLSIIKWNVVAIFNSNINCSFFSELPHISPMIIAVWCGTTKPSNLSEYLGRFVHELNHLLNEPIAINNHTIHVKLRCFICDTPARAFIKGLRIYNIIRIYI